MNLLTLTQTKWIFAFCIFLSSVLAYFPALYSHSSPKIKLFPSAKALSTGIFLGAALMHMLEESIIGFNSAQYNFPWATFLAGTTFLILLWLEHLGRELSHHNDQSDPSIAKLATLMLCFHSIFEGAALGADSNLASSSVLFGAIMAHKWAASFALACHLIESRLSKCTIILLFSVFTLSTPLSSLLVFYELSMTNSPILSPICNAMAAGTFLYIGTLHGLRRAVMIDRCCDLRQFIFVILGFLMMATLALWL